MIGRRGFLKCIGAAVLGAAVALQAPARKPKAGTGMAVRLVSHWDPVSSERVNRFDVFYGVGMLQPDRQVRIEVA